MPTLAARLRAAVPKLLLGSALLLGAGSLLSAGAAQAAANMQAAADPGEKSKK